MHCLAKHPQQRFASAAELVHAIRRWQHRRWWTGQALADRLGPGRFRLLAGAAVLLAVLIPVGFFVWFANWNSDGVKPSGMVIKDGTIPPTDKRRAAAYRDKNSDKGRDAAYRDKNSDQEDWQDWRVPDGTPARHDFSVQVELLRKVAGNSEKFRPYPKNKAGLYLIPEKPACGFASAWLGLLTSVYGMSTRTKNLSSFCPTNMKPITGWTRTSR
jgi:hypothetical protein